MEARKLRDLTPDARNANKGTPRSGQMVEDSLRQYGAGRSILIDKHGHNIAGNETAEHAGSIGLEDVLVVQTDGTKLVAGLRMDLDLATDQAAKELTIADNRAGQVSLAWDPEVLAEMAGEIDLGKFFTADELAAVLGDPDKKDLLTDPDDVPEAPGVAVTRPGDVYVMGDHRLVCGDSTLAATYVKLMVGEQAEMCWTDRGWTACDAIVAQTREEGIAARPRTSCLRGSAS